MKYLNASDAERGGASRLKRMRYGLWSVVTAAAIAALTVLIAVGPGLRYAYFEPSWRIVLDTAATLVAALVAYLAVGRFRQSRRSDDLLVVSALAVIALAHVFLVSLPRLLLGTAGERFSIWMPLGARMVAGALLAVAAVGPSFKLKRSRRAPRRAWVVAGTAFAFAAALALGWLVTSNLPGESAVTIPARLSDQPRPWAHPGIAATEMLVAGLFVVAAIGFVKRAGRTRDSFFGWLGIGCVLAAGAGVEYAIFPSLDTQLFSVGDALRLCAYLAWLIGAAGEIASYWAEINRLAVTEERRRLARDLHDGLAQELAFIVSEAHGLAASGPVDPKVAQLRAAAERALHESRRAIVALSSSAEEPIGVDLARTTEQVAQPSGLQVKVDVDDSVVLDPLRREALIRIVREAVTNAIRHGHAHRVTVELSTDGGPHLYVRDDGVGFDPRGPDERDGGFGLTSMRERAFSLGASFNVDSRPGEGTIVEVAWT